MESRLEGVPILPLCVGGYNITQMSGLFALSHKGITRSCARMAINFQSSKWVGLVGLDAWGRACFFFSSLVMTMWPTVVQWSMLYASAGFFSRAFFCIHLCGLCGSPQFSTNQCYKWSQIILNQHKFGVAKPQIIRNYQKVATNNFKIKGMSFFAPPLCERVSPRNAIFKNREGNWCQ